LSNNICCLLLFQLHLALAVAHQHHLPFKNFADHQHLNGHSIWATTVDDAASTSSGAKLFNGHGSRRTNWEERNGATNGDASRSAPLSRSSSRYSMPGGDWPPMPPPMLSQQRLQQQTPMSILTTEDCPVCQMLLPAGGPVCQKML
jgi:hypothetical protein